MVLSNSGELCHRSCCKVLVSLPAAFLKAGINAHLADITELHRLKRDLETDNNNNLERPFPLMAAMS